MNADNPWDTLFRCLTAKPRRRILIGLASHEPTEQVHFTDIHPDEIAPETSIHTAYIHMHLPKLSSAGYIVWDDQTNDISQGPRFDEIESFLELVQTNTERLPEGWV